MNSNNAEFEREKRINQAARDALTNIPPALKRDLAGLFRLVEIQHTGTDAFGNRFRGESFATLLRTIRATEQTITKRYGYSMMGELNWKYCLDIHEVRDAIVAEDEQRILEAKRTQDKDPNP
jgi:hypothetical protein